MRLVRAAVKGLGMAGFSVSCKEVARVAENGVRGSGFGEENMGTCSA
jgi:hypothetical protein